MPTVFREFWRLFGLERLLPLAAYSMQRWDVTLPREVDTLLGACLMLRREALNAAGFLDESYFMYSEEIDLCFRLRRLGWRAFWVPEAEVVHYWGQSAEQASAKMFLELYRSKCLFFKKHGGRLRGKLFKLVLLAASAVRVASSLLAYGSRSPARARLLRKARLYRQLMINLPRM
jgi:hypothetical protein